MDTPALNFAAAVGIGLVIGLIAGFLLKGRSPNAIWMAPVLAIAGAVLASVLALIFGDTTDYGWKEPIVQVVLALAGAASTYFIGGRKESAAA